MRPAVSVVARAQPEAYGWETSIVATAQQFDNLVPEWRHLVQHASNDVELQHDPDVVRLMLADPSQSLSPRFIVVRKDGRVRCIAPFYLHLTKVPLRLSVIQLASFRVRALRLFGDKVILHSDVDPEEGLQHIFETLHRIRRTFDVLWIHTQRIGDPLWTFITSPAAARWLFRPIVTSPHPEKLHRLTLNRTFDEYLAEVRSKVGFPGKAIRRFWRDMKERCAVTQITERAQVRPFLDDLDLIYNASWQARTYGERRRNTAPEVARLEAIASLGYLRSYVLKEDGTPIAFVLGYQYRGRYTYDETGYDSRRAVLSPGSILTHAAIEDLFRSNSPHEIDFGFGDGAYKRTFGNTAYDVCSLYLVQRGRWRIILGAQRFLNVAYELIRSMVIRARIDATVRRIVKRQR